MLRRPVIQAALGGRSRTTGGNVISFRNCNIQRMTQRISAWRTPLAAQIDAAGLPSDPLPPAPRCRALALCHLPLSVTMRKDAGSKIKKYREVRREGGITRAPGARPAMPKKAKKVTPKVARARKLQGQYLGALKSLKGADWARVKKTAAEKRVSEAVKLTQSLKK